MRCADIYPGRHSSSCFAKAFWNLDPVHLPYLQMAAARGLGTVEYDKLPVHFSQL